MQKPLKPLYFMNEMHEYEFKSFSKTIEFNLDLPKTRFSHFLSPKLKQKNIFCIKIKEHIILDDQLHTQFHVLSLAKNNLSSVCN